MSAKGRGTRQAAKKEMLPAVGSTVERWEERRRSRLQTPSSSPQPQKKRRYTGGREEDIPTLPPQSRYVFSSSHARGKPIRLITSSSVTPRQDNEAANARNPVHGKNKKKKEREGSPRSARAVCVCECNGETAYNCARGGLSHACACATKTG